MLDTDQLRSFLAIVDTGSFTRAAERVNKTQSAVSMHVRRLEEQIGRTLFVKQGRGTRLTADGERLVEHARRMLQVEAAALHDLRAHGLTGRVTLGIPDDYAEPFVPAIVGGFARLHPLVELSILCQPTIVLAERVGTGEVDVAVVTENDRTLGAEHLREERLRWVTGLRAGPLDEQRPVPLALSTPACAWRRAALAALAEAGIPFRVFLMSSNYAALSPVVQAGLALTVLPEVVVNPAIHRVLPVGGGLPVLPTVRVGLLRAPSGETPEAAALAAVVRASIGTGRVMPAYDVAA